ncbi:(d)CMP kinase [soil metagenome]
MVGESGKKKPSKTHLVDPSGVYALGGARGPVLTIDGPAASGKSSVSRELARRLGWRWVSTGTFYRGIAWAAHEVGVDLEDEGALVAFIGSARWKVELTAPTTCFFLDGFDRTDEITKETVGSLASKISSYPRVRVALLDAQRKCATLDQGLIAEGRDCGTVVFPRAEVKVFLTARAEDRAQRRANDEGLSVEETISEQEQRDRQDTNRTAAPMTVPEGALKIDTSQHSFLEVVEQIERLVRATITIEKQV